METGAYMNQPEIEVFSHNPLHDIESVWWVGLWFLLCHYQPRNLLEKGVQRHIKVVKNYGETLFNDRFDPLSRRRALTGTNVLGNIEPEFFSNAVQHLIFLLDEFRVGLFKYYRSYNPTASQDRSFFNPDLHRKFSDVIEEAMEDLKNDETELWLLQHISNETDYLTKKLKK